MNFCISQNNKREKTENRHLSGRFSCDNLPSRVACPFLKLSKGWTSRAGSIAQTSAIVQEWAKATLVACLEERSKATGGLYLICHSEELEESLTSPLLDSKTLHKLFDRILISAFVLAKLFFATFDGQKWRKSRDQSSKMVKN